MIHIQSSANVGFDGIKCLVYGKSGVGKTPLCATAPAPIIFSAEKGLLSIKRVNPPVPWIDISNYASLTEACGWLQSSYEARQFYTPCLDSLSEICEVLLTEEMKKNKDGRKAYGNMLLEGIRLVKWFRDLPGRSVVLVAKEEWIKDDSTGMMLYQPMMPGSKLGNQLPYFFDETLRMTSGRDVNGQEWRALSTKLSTQWVARDRSGMLNELEYPNLTSVFSKILSI